MSLHLPRRRWGTRNMSSYEKLDCIGAGTYGQVFTAKEKGSDEVVAIKKIRSLNEVQGLPVTTIREIKVLKCMDHPNLVKLKEVIVSVEDDEDDANRQAGFVDKEDPLDYCRGSIFLVLEYVEHDLTGLIDRQHPFTDIAIKSISKQLLQVMKHMHSLDIIHRDIKCSNLLLTNQHLLKVADFGLARSIRGDQLFTNKVVTLWYRPPELLLGATSYDASVDMWSIGCVMAELYIGHPLFQGKTEMEQIHKIFDLCGTPTLDSWPDYKFLPSSNKFVPAKSKPRRLHEYLLREASSRKKIFPKGALELIESLLELDPEKRLTAAQALESTYFQVRPLAPSDPQTMPHISNLPPSHEYQTKKIRREHAKNLANGANGSNAPSGGGDRAPRGSSPSVEEDGTKAKAEEEKPGSEGTPSKVKRRREGERGKEVPKKRKE